MIDQFLTAYDLTSLYANQIQELT